MSRFACATDNDLNYLEESAKNKNTTKNTNKVDKCSTVLSFRVSSPHLVNLSLNVLKKECICGNRDPLPSHPLRFPL